MDLCQTKPSIKLHKNTPTANPHYNDLCPGSGIPVLYFQNNRYCSYFLELLPSYQTNKASSCKQNKILLTWWCSIYILDSWSLIFFGFLKDQISNSFIGKIKCWFAIVECRIWIATIFYDEFADFITIPLSSKVNRQFSNICRRIFIIQLFVNL